MKQPLVIFVHFHQIYGFSVVCYQKKNSLHKDSVTWSWYIFQGCLLVSGSLIRFFGDVLGRRFHLCDHHHSSKMVIFLTKWVGFMIVRDCRKILDFLEILEMTWGLPETPKDSQEALDGLLKTGTF